MKHLPRDFKDRRSMLNCKAMEYLLDKFRDEIQDKENKNRQALKITLCRHCDSINGCKYCQHMS